MQLIGTNGARRACAREVDRARDDLLAGAALAGDQHARPAARRSCGSARRSRASRGSCRSGRRTTRSDRRRGAGAGSPPRARAARRRARASSEQRVALEGLGDVVEGAGVHRLDGGVDAAEGRHQHDRRVGPQLADLPEQLDAGAARHADVGEHDVAVELARAARAPRRRSPAARAWMPWSSSSETTISRIAASSSTTRTERPADMCFGSVEHVACQLAASPRGAGGTRRVRFVTHSPLWRRGTSGVNRSRTSRLCAGRASWHIRLQRPARGPDGESIGHIRVARLEIPISSLMRRHWIATPP